ncbi:MAG: hypothetical protein HGB21_02390 [Nitrospirae bacterium]|nr:hypothetical protein [Nitrospirota bacterium]NTW65152.1 hypothetical protein [Nitrospirota bacterium]
MPIWTTPELNELLTIKELPLRLLPPKQIKAAFLAEAAPGDMAVINIDDDYLEFLVAAKERSMSGPIILISPEPTIVESDLHRYHALVLDLKKMGTVAVKNIVHVIVNLAMQQANALNPDMQTVCMASERAEDHPIEDRAAIRERLRFAQKNEIPAMIAFETMENGEPVKVRGLCSIREMTEDSLVFHKFKQSTLLKAMKKGLSIQLYFTYKQKNHGSTVTIQSTTDKDVITSVPTHLFIARELRIQPSQSKPIGLYVLIPNEPTTIVQVTDISPRGIGFVCMRDLPVDNVYGLTIMLPDPQAVVVTGGIIRFKKESGQGIRYGAEIRPHPWDEESIARYVMNREAEIINLLRNR